jgi:hypothetical protein
MRVKEKHNYERALRLYLNVDDLTLSEEQAADFFEMNTAARSASMTPSPVSGFMAILMSRRAVSSATSNRYLVR